MAPRQASSGNNNAARDIVSDSLGMDLDDLGVGSDDNDLDDSDGIGDSGELDGEPEFLGPDDDDGGLDAALDQDDRGRRDQRQQRDRVSHTRGNPFKKGAEVKPDGKGNLVDPATGQIVAKAGREATLYQRAFKAGEGAKVGGLQYQLRQANEKLNRAVNLGRQLAADNTKYKGNAEALKQFKIGPEDHLRAFKLFSDLQNNPAETLKGLLTRAAANGIKVDEIVQGGIQGVDAKALTDLIKEELGKVTAPLVERNKNETEAAARQRETDQRNERIAEDTRTFFEMNDEARPYMPVFVRLMESNPEYAAMSLGEIWARIQLHEARNGKSFQPRRNGNRTDRSRPQGRSHPVARNSEMAPLNQDYGSILKDILDEQGIVR